MNGIENLLSLFKSSTGVTIDSRNVAKGNLFFALKGEQSDGNKFAKAAIDSGAACAIIDNPEYSIEGKTFLVEDSLRALQQLATAYRSSLNIPVIGLTGSNGKTTTKELMQAVLSRKFKTFATKGNLNNHIGVPLSILSISNDHEMAVIEMGANHQKEIEFLCSIAKPTHGLITNIGLAHLEGFGGPDGVIKGKTELFTYLKQGGGVIFANTNEPKLNDVYDTYQPTVTYGYRGDENVTGKIIKNNQFATVEINNSILVTSQLIGDYNADNILAAACVGNFFNVPMDDIKTAVENYTPENNRSEFRKIGDNYFILDAYNANPSSMQAAIQNFNLFPAGDKIVILGDMLELGEYADAEHKRIFELASGGDFSELIFVGPVFQKTVKPSGRVKTFATSEEAAGYVVAQNFQNKQILLKGSRGIRLEKIIDMLK